MRARLLAARLVLLCAALACAAVAHAHEVRPAAFEARAIGEAMTQITWRQPVSGDYAVPLVPRLSAGWLDRAPDAEQLTSQTLTRVWREAMPVTALAGQTLSVEGLGNTLTDVFVRIDWPRGRPLVTLLKPVSPSMQIPVPGARGGSLAYLALGATHIWGGYDHLLYLIGLMLLVRGRWQLAKVISAFTLAHSVTLALSALDLVVLPTAPVEAAIALSIVMVAAEAARACRGGDSLTLRRPWLVALLFGLLHGFGFAGALRETGLPADAVALPLLLFNLGIEMGQLLFVAAVGALGIALGRMAPALLRGTRAVLPLLLGGIAMAWLYERALALA
jgi:hypothetical protein